MGQTNVQVSHRALSSAKDRTEKVNYWKIFEAGMGTHSGQQVNARMPGARTREALKNCCKEEGFPTMAAARVA